MNWKQWLKAAGVRAIKTVCQTAIATIGTSMVIADVDWLMVVSASLLAGLLSLLMSVTGLPEVDDGTSPLDASTPAEDTQDES